ALCPAPLLRIALPRVCGSAPNPGSVARGGPVPRSFLIHGGAPPPPWLRRAFALRSGSGLLLRIALPRVCGSAPNPGSVARGGPVPRSFRTTVGPHPTVAASRVRAPQRLRAAPPHRASARLRLRPTPGSVLSDLKVDLVRERDTYVGPVCRPGFYH